MKCLVTGGDGQLGYDLIQQLKARGHETLGVDVVQMDITKEEQVEKVFSDFRPDVVFHCAAYTAVDRAEEEVALCNEINIKGTQNIVNACTMINAKLIYLSTDYVFDGTGTRPWKPDDVKQPLNVYGQSKYEGEKIIQACMKRYFIVRISWVFGKNGKNFVDTMCRLGKERGAVSVVDDQIGSPTYTWDLSKLLIDMAETDQYGAYHATNEGICSWYDFAKTIFKEAGMDVEVTPVSSEEFPSKAKRPKNSRMSKEKLREKGFSLLPTWQDAVKRYINS